MKELWAQRNVKDIIPEKLTDVRRVSVASQEA